MTAAVAIIVPLGSIKEDIGNIGQSGHGCRLKAQHIIYQEAVHSHRLAARLNGVVHNKTTLPKVMFHGEKYQLCDHRIIGFIVKFNHIVHRLYEWTLSMSIGTFKCSSQFQNEAKNMKWVSHSSIWYDVSLVVNNRIYLQYDNKITHMSRLNHIKTMKTKKKTNNRNEQSKIWKAKQSD